MTQEQYNELGDIPLLVGTYVNQNQGMVLPDDNWNPAAFSFENIENPSCGFWRFANLSKPTAEQLQAIKSAMEIPQEGI